MIHIPFNLLKMEVRVLPQFRAIQQLSRYLIRRCQIRHEIEKREIRPLMITHFRYLCHFLVRFNFS